MTPRDIACNELVELLTEYLEGTLPPDEVAAVEEHLRGCEACQTYLDQLRATITALGSATVPNLPDAGVDALLAAFGRQDPGR
jgi:anti-sigma factor RsiW